jgi:hypothetical protein
VKKGKLVFKPSHQMVHPPFYDCPCVQKTAVCRERNDDHFLSSKHRVSCLGHLTHPLGPSVQKVSYNWETFFMASLTQDETDRRRKNS